MNLDINLSPAQKKRLNAAVKNGTSFTAKLSHANLQGSGLSLPVGKVVHNKVQRSIRDKKGMVVKMSEKDVLKYGAKITPSSIGGAIPVAGVIAAVGMVSEFIDKNPKIKNMLDGIALDLKYALENPVSVEIKWIIGVDFPNLNKRYRDLENEIVFTKKKLKKTNKKQNPIIWNSHDNHIIGLEKAQDDITSHIKALVEKLPNLIRLSKQRDTQLANRDNANKAKELQAAKDKVESLGGGLQVGDGLIIDSIKSKIKKEITKKVVKKIKQ